MKALRTNTIKIFCLLNLGLFVSSAALGVALAAEPNETGTGKVCGVLRNFDGRTEVFDYTRTQIGETSFGKKLHCGDWISVDKGKATIEYGTAGALSVGENTFFQILDPQSGENPEGAHFALYRGEFLAQANTGEIRVVTPNAVARLEKGGAFLVYSTETDESQIVGLGAKASLENRFFGSPRMPAEYAKVVTFSNPVERLIPDQSRFVNSHDLNERLARLGVPATVLDTLDKIVKAGVKTKMPVTLAVTAHPAAKKIERVAATGELSGANRAPASLVAAPKKPTAVARKKMVADEPNFALKRQSVEDSEKKRLLQALSTMHGEDEEL